MYIGTDRFTKTGVDTVRSVYQKKDRNTWKMRVKQPEIIFEDDAVIVCRKEAGVAVQTARAGQADMVSLLKNYRAKKKEEPYIGLIHRLDQPVEGVMVFAKTKQAVRSGEQPKYGKRISGSDRRHSAAVRRRTL